MTKFTVVASNGKATDYSGNYKIEGAGVLAIKPESGNPVVYSPSGWLYVEITDAPQSAYADNGLTVI